jgi:hypothetical protein
VAVLGFFKDVESAEAKAFAKTAEAVDDQVERGHQYCLVVLT